eukprot:NODE_244_length_11882_cov_0.560214.p6 type:complete len:236 gc:universal NODE_244_length_11882_cov_0.560214:9386-8679(-)
MRILLDHSEPLDFANLTNQKFPKSKITVLQNGSTSLLKGVAIDFENEEDGNHFLTVEKAAIKLEEEENTVKTKYSEIVVINPIIPQPDLSSVTKLRYDRKFRLPLAPIDSTFAVFIPSQYLSFNNINVYDYNLFGTDMYTDDSDLVAVSIHTNQFTPIDDSPFSTELMGDNSIGVKRFKHIGHPIAPKFHLILIIQVTYPLEIYNPCFRYNMPSRGFALHDGNSIKIVKSLQQDI